MNIIFIVALSVVSLFEELHVKRYQEKNTLISGIYTYAVPVIYFLGALLLCYIQVNYHFIFLMGLGVVTISLVPYMIHFKRRVNEQFLLLEVSN